MMMLWRMPSEIKRLRSELPPWLTNGNGMPVTGKSPRFTAMLMNVCMRMSTTIPTATS